MKHLKRTTAFLITLILAAAMLLEACSNTDVNITVNLNTNSNEVTPAVTDNLKWWQETIAYEIYVKSFKDSYGDGHGDLNGIISELDHLKNLGVEAIWLTPCYVSPQADNGYDIADYYNIDPAYGTMEDMDRLISEADKRGIRIVMDLVFNHTSDQNAWFKESASGKDNGSIFEGSPEMGRKERCP